MTKQPLYRVWSAIKDRTLNKNDTNWEHYGGRGIDICEEWINNPVAFIEWSNNNGYKKGLEIDRIDNNKGYSPENCRYVTRKVNTSNTRNNRYCTIKNEKVTFTEAERILGKYRGYLSKVVKYNRFHLLPDSVAIL